MSHQCQLPVPKSASGATAIRNTFVPFCWMYWRIQIQALRASSWRTSWSQQKPPAAEGSTVNGSTCVHVVPPSTDRLAYQLPVTNTASPDIATDGSPTVDVASFVAASSRPRLWMRETAAGDIGDSPASKDQVSSGST